MAEKLAIIGMGNADMGDDAIGVILVEKLREELESGAWRPAHPEAIELIVAGADPLLAGACLMEAPRALLLDAAEMREAPGELRFFSPEEAVLAAGTAERSAHTMPLAEVLELVRELGSASRLKIAGIQPAEVGAGLGLSPSLTARVGQMMSKIKEEVSQLP